MSIFGQVWLWSVLAFFVGALVAWLVLVLPARKRVRQLEEALASARAENARTPANAAALAAGGGTAVLAPVAAESHFGFTEPEPSPPREPVASSWARDENEPAPTELIGATQGPGFEPEAEYEAKYRTAPDVVAEPESEPQHESAYETEPAAAASPVDSGSVYRAAAAEYLNPAGRDLDGAAAFTSGEDDHDSGYYRAPDTIESRLEPFGSTETDSAERPAEPVSLFRKPVPESDWFTKETSVADDETESDYLEEHETTDHLTPGTTRAAEPSTSDAPGSTTGDVTGATTGDEPLEPGALPKRQPREAPRGGFEPPRPIEPSMRPVERRDPGLTGAQSGSLFEPSVQPNQVASLAAPEPPPARDSDTDAVPPGPFGPGSAMPRPGGGRPSDAFTVKASVTALRYCTEESPQFARMVAEVWFRTPADAERVGFRMLAV
ncbi:MAG TPA: hypothetical protein VG674_29100 [Amycolatopsis sp.]|nr:hypothetical protein [Amycolatopsis sp.]